MPVRIILCLVLTLFACVESNAQYFKKGYSMGHAPKCYPPFVQLFDGTYIPAGYVAMKGSWVQVGNQKIRMREIQKLSSGTDVIVNIRGKHCKLIEEGKINVFLLDDYVLTMGSPMAGGVRSSRIKRMFVEDSGTNIYYPCKFHTLNRLIPQNDVARNDFLRYRRRHRIGNWGTLCSVGLLSAGIGIMINRADYGDDPILYRGFAMSITGCVGLFPSIFLRSVRDKNKAKIIAIHNGMLQPIEK